VAVRHRHDVSLRQPPVALDAAPLIHDPDLRAKAFEHVAEIWARTQRAAAVDFIEGSHALDASQKKAITQRIGGRRSPPATSTQMLTPGAGSSGRE